jgi:hypothetical protein
VIFAQVTIPTTLEGYRSCRKCFPLIWGGWTRLGTTRSVKYLLQGKNIRFKDEHTFLHGILWGSLALAVIPVALDGHALDVELESEFCLSLICPIPQGLFGHTGDELGRLMNVQVSAGFIDVRFELRHRDTQRHFVPQFKDDDWGTDRGFQLHPCDQADGFYQ